MDASSNDAFTIVGAGYRAHQPAIRKKGFWARLKGKPTLSVAVFSVIALGCLFSNLIINHDPAELFLMNVNEAPNAEFWFGTDSLGRDIYSIIWYGGRASIFIGLMSAAVITLIGVFYGCLSGVASGVVDSAMMRAVELLQSVPVLLSLLLILSLMGKPNELTIALVIGVTGWAGIAKVVRTEVRRLRTSEYVLAARCMGGGFFHVLWEHLAPNFLSAILFMVVMNVQSAILAESTLSFLGLGLPLEVISWGSMLSLAQQALLTKSWWAVVIPGIFLVATLLSVTLLGNALRYRNSHNRGKI